MKGVSRPPGLDPEMSRYLDRLEQYIERVIGAKNVDWHGRRIMNAGSAQDDNDYLTLLDAKNLIAKALRGGSGRSILGASASGVPGGGGGGGLWVPTVPAPDHSSIVEAYAAANPSQLADSCQSGGGSWDFMDGVVNALQNEDPRYGFNAKRGDPNDPSEDAVSYYAGEMSLMVAGSIEVYVFDIIGNHCGASPTPAWINQTVIGSSGAGWLPTRPGA